MARNGIALHTNIPVHGFGQPMCRYSCNQNTQGSKSAGVRSAPFPFVYKGQHTLILSYFVFLTSRFSKVYHTDHGSLHSCHRRRSCYWQSRRRCSILPRSKKGTTISREFTSRISSHCFNASNPTLAKGRQRATLLWQRRKCCCDWLWTGRLLHGLRANRHTLKAEQESCGTDSNVNKYSDVEFCEQG